MERERAIDQLAMDLILCVFGLRVDVLPFKVHRSAVTGMRERAVRVGPDECSNLCVQFFPKLKRLNENDWT